MPRLGIGKLTQRRDSEPGYTNLRGTDGFCIKRPRKFPSTLKVSHHIEFIHELHGIVKATCLHRSALFVLRLRPTAGPEVVGMLRRNRLSRSAAKRFLIGVDFAGKLNQLSLRQAKHRAYRLAAPLKNLLCPLLGSFTADVDVVLQKLPAKVLLGASRIELLRHRSLPRCPETYELFCFG